MENNNILQQLLGMVGGSGGSATSGGSSNGGFGGVIGSMFGGDGKSGTSGGLGGLLQGQKGAWNNGGGSAVSGLLGSAGSMIGTGMAANASRGGFENKNGSPRLGNIKDAQVGAGMAEGVKWGSKLGKINPILGIIGTVGGAAIGAAVGGQKGDRLADIAETRYNSDVAQSKITAANNSTKLQDQDMAYYNLENINRYKMGGTHYGSFDNGGGRPNAIVDNKEIIKSPMGDIQEAIGPKATDKILASLMPGSKILSDTMQFGGKTYAELGKNLPKVKEMSDKVLADKASTRIDRQTAKLNLKNADSAFEQIMTIQEDNRIVDNVGKYNEAIRKYKCGGKTPKYKLGGISELPKFRDGVYGAWDTEANRKAYFEKYGELSGGKNVQWNDMNHVLDNKIRGGEGEGAWDTVGGYMRFGQNLSSGTAVGQPQGATQTALTGEFANGNGAVSDSYTMSGANGKTPAVQTTTPTTTTPETRSASTFDPNGVDENGVSYTNGVADKPAYFSATNDTQSQWDAEKAKLPQNDGSDFVFQGQPDPKVDNGGTGTKPGGMNVSGLFGDLKDSASRLVDLAPYFYNMRKAGETVEKINPEDYTTKGRAIADTYNPEPELKQNRKQVAIARRQAAMKGSGNSADMAFSAYLARQKASMDSAVWDKKNKYDNNQRSAVQATNIGLEGANNQIRMSVNEMNMKSKAKSHDFEAKAVQQLSEWNQRNRLDSTKKGQDEINLDALLTDLKRTLTPEQYKEIAKSAKNRGYNSFIS